MQPSGEQEITPDGVVEISTRWSGPLPPPEIVEQYETALPGSGERILRMAEEEQAHRHQQEIRILAISELEIRNTHWTRCFGIVVAALPVLTGLLLTLNGQPRNGVVLLLGNIVLWGVIGVIRMIKGDTNSTSGEVG